MNSEYIYDVVIVGGGPAGLSAAIILGRCRRKILVFDTDNPRNKKAKEIHGYLTRDGIHPEEFLNIGRKELDKYQIKILSKEILRATIENNLFVVEDSNKEKYTSKKLLLATGIVDTLPEIEGMDEYYGISIFHCPYCDGWEARDKTIAVYGKGKRGFELSLSLKTWSDKILLLTDGDIEFNEEELDILHVNGIKLYAHKVQRFSGNNDKLERIVFANQEQVLCDTIFFCNGYRQHSDLGYQLNLNFSDKKVIITDQYQETAVPGLFVAGDADKDMHYVIIAAAEGAKAGTKINMELQRESRLKPNRIESESYSSNV